MKIRIHSTFTRHVEEENLVTVHVFSTKPKVCRFSIAHPLQFLIFHHLNIFSIGTLFHKPPKPENMNKPKCVPRHFVWDSALGIAVKIGSGKTQLFRPRG